MRLLCLSLLLLVFSGCSNLRSEEPMDEKHVLIYLHGMIVENQGKNAHHPEYGDYEFDNIIATFREKGFDVLSEVRPPNTDISTYADQVVKQVNELIEGGTSPSNITVLGASKGSMIAMVASTRLQRENVNFIFMAACNEWTATNLNLRPCGRILSIYEESDEIGRSCGKIVGTNECVTDYKEIVLKTGKKHGFLFKPLAEWVEPSVEWALENAEAK